MYKKSMLLLFALIASALFASSAFALGSGAQVKNFTLKDLSGKNVSLDQYKGKVVVLNFWATWCPPCRNEMPEFDEMNKEFKKSGGAVLLAELLCAEGYIDHR